MDTIFDSQHWLSLIRNGLPQNSGTGQRVVVVGAGMAGLVAASALLKAGHDPIILEGTHRVGGRVFTVRDPFADGLHAEAGAMRIPQSHDLTMEYVHKFGLTVSPFTMDNLKACVHIHGTRRLLADYQAEPNCFDFEVSPHERGKTVGQLWLDTIRPIVEKLQEEGEAAWPEIVQRYDQYCTREFLEANSWSEGAIEMFGLLLNQEAVMNSSFVELLREEAGQYYTNMVQIDGGMDRLPRAFLPELHDRIRYGAKMFAIEQSDSSVTVHYRTSAGRSSITADRAILTVPFPVMRHVEVMQPFSKGKQRAIRQLHYDASAKVFLQCRRRFWEEDDGIVGGGTVTDLAVRNIYYPEHGRETGRGVLLASYTWAEDAQRWGSLSPEDRISQAIENVAQIHPQIIEEFEVGTSKMWHDDEFAGGAFALFDPGQQTLLHEHIVAPEGRVYFAGEHASLFHAWIQGAIQSGLRAAEEVHAAGAPAA